MFLFAFALINGGFDTLAIVKLKTENAVIVYKPARNEFNILEPFSPKYDYIEVVKEEVPEGVVLHLHIPQRMIGQIDRKAFRDWYNGVLNLLHEVLDNPQILDVNNSCTRAGCPSCEEECALCNDGWKLYKGCMYVCYYGFQRCDSQEIDYFNARIPNIWNQSFLYYGYHTIYDINGRKVFEGKLNGKLPGLKKGVYFIKGEDGKVRRVAVR